MHVGVYPPLWRGNAPRRVSDNAQIEPGPRIPEGPLVLRVTAPALVMALRLNDDARYGIGTLDGRGDDDLAAPFRHGEGIVEVMGWQDGNQARVILCDV